VNHARRNDEARTCACGCGRSLEDRRANTRYATRECRETVAQERRERALQARLARNQRKLDLRIAYGRVVARYGERAARELLTERQRAAVEEREART
jgi:hypothetical protein